MKYTKKQMRLINHINNVNADAKSMMDELSNLWVGKLTNDPDHWAAYGVYTPEDFEKYLDNEMEASSELISYS
jgi:hypothetical protein